MIDANALRDVATRYENATLKERTAVIAEARLLVPERIRRALNIYGLKQGWVVLMPDNVLTSAFGVNVRTGFDVLQALVDGHVIMPNQKDSSAYVLSAFGRAIVSAEYAAMDGVKDSALDAYVGELQATPPPKTTLSGDAPLYSWNTSTGDATVTETPNAASVTYPLRNMPTPPADIERVLATLADKDADLAERLQQSLAGNGDE